MILCIAGQKHLCPGLKWWKAEAGGAEGLWANCLCPEILRMQDFKVAWDSEMNVPRGPTFTPVWCSIPDSYIMWLLFGESRLPALNDSETCLFWILWVLRFWGTIIIPYLNCVILNSSTFFCVLICCYYCSLKWGFPTSMIWAHY